MFLKILVELLIAIKLSSFKGADDVICFKIFIYYAKEVKMLLSTLSVIEPSA